MRRNVSATMSLVLAIPFTATVAGAAVRPLAAASPVTCAIPKPCAMFTNTNTGPAVEGASASGAGLFGTSSSGVYYEPGVDGESSDPDGEDAAGAFGLNAIATGVAPQYGVLAYGNGIGLAGEENSAGSSVDTSGYGVYGQDSTGTASASGDYNVGTVGASTAGTGVLGESNGSPGTLDFGKAPIGVYAVANTVSGTPRAYAYSFIGETNSTQGVAMLVFNTATGASASLLPPGDLINLQASGSSYFYVENNGNAVLSGTLTTSKSTYVRAIGASGAAMMEYGDRMTAPQVEDVGEGQLANGRAYVNIDARLADTIDRRSSYLVFVTPQGECNGLYVTQKSASGFAVRELHGGRSSLAFDYRIVAKPRDDDGTRLANAPPLKTRADDGLYPAGKMRGMPMPLSPGERLKRRMGTQAYAQAMFRFRSSRLTAP